MTVTIENTYTGNGSTTDYSFTFPYLDTPDIKASLAGINTTAFTLLNATTVRFSSAPGNGVAIRIYRETDFEDPKATFYPGSAIRASDLNDNALQNLYVNQESNDKVANAWLTGDPTIISTESWHTSDDTKIATTKAIENRIDTKIDSALVDDIAAGSSIAITDNSPSSGKVTIGVIASTGSNSGSMSAADKTKLDGIESNATADQTNAEIRAAVEAASDSNVFTDADHSKLNGIEASATADQTAAEIRTLVESATDSNVFTDADHSKLNAIEASATADQTASEIKTLLQSDKLTDSEIATGTLDNRYFTETELTGGALDGRYFTETESDARYFNVSTGDTIKDGDTFPDNDTTIATTAAINDRIIDLVDDVGGFVPIANETSFPNANPDVNNGAGTLVSIKALSSNLTSNGSGVATISNGTVGNSTVTINGLANSTTYAATFGMIVETTTTLNTYTFHRLVPKATEVTTVAGSISNVNTVAGSIANVNTVAGNNSNVNTVAGNNANITTVAGISSNVTSVAGNATNINAVNSNSSNINTVAGSISNVNTTAGSISNVNTVASNISSVNDFADRYRVASSDPGSNNDTGDLVFNTTSNELRVYNGSAWQGGVTATSNLLPKSGGQMTGNITFSGSQTVDGRDVSADGTKLDGISANANNYTHPNHSGEVTSSADGATVIADNVVDEANLKVSNSPTNGQFLQAQSGNTGGLTWASVSSYTHPNHSGEVTSTGDGATVIADNVVDEANLKINNTGSTGQFLSKVSTGSGLAWDNIPSTSPGGSNTYIQYNNNGSFDGIPSLYVNSPANFDIKFQKAGGGSVYWDYSEAEFKFEDNVPAIFGDGDDLEIKHDTSQAANYITSTNRDLHIQTGTNGNETGIRVYKDGKVDLSYDGSVKLETTSSGATVTGTVTATSGFSGSGANLTNLPAPTPAGSNTQIQFNNSGSLGASSGFTYDGSVVKIDTSTNGKLELRGSSAPKIQLHDAAGNLRAHFSHNVNGGNKLYLWNNHSGTGIKFDGTLQWWDGSGHRDILHQGNVGNGGALSGYSLYAGYFYGDGSNLTNLPSTTINNNANNRVITGSGSANTLEAESSLTFDGTKLVTPSIELSSELRTSGSVDIKAGSSSQYDAIKLNSNGEVDIKYQGNARIQVINDGTRFYNNVLFKGGIQEDGVVISSSGGAATLDQHSGTNFEHTLTENVTYTFSNPAPVGDCSSFTLRVTQDSTARTITWPSSSNIYWAGGTAPTLSTGSGDVDIFVFITYNGGTTYYGFTAGQDFS